MLSGLDALEVPIGEAAREAPAEALVDPDDAGVAVNRDLVRAGREVAKYSTTLRLTDSTLS